MPDIQDGEEGANQQDLLGDNLASATEPDKNKQTSSSGESQRDNKKSENLTKSAIAITSVITLDANQGGSDGNAANTEESAETSSGDQQLRLSRIERMIDEQQHHLNEGAQVHQSVQMLRQIQTELKSHVQALMKQQNQAEQKADGAQKDEQQ